jgi:hypothetical protein
MCGNTSFFYHRMSSIISSHCTLKSQPLLSSHFILSKSSFSLDSMLYLEKIVQQAAYFTRHRLTVTLVISKRIDVAL